MHENSYCAVLLTIHQCRFPADTGKKAAFCKLLHTATCHCILQTAGLYPNAPARPDATDNRMVLFFRLISLEETCFCIAFTSFTEVCIRDCARQTACMPCLTLLLKFVLCLGSTGRGVMMEEVSCAWLPSKVVTVQYFTPVC